ncbi:MAG: hypothetical protein WBN83_09480 [Desulfoprunum sp.]|jgi:hypothetical protein|uniref:hypothetical protein n=1 Tax=Desulfoprunum sp. TaxID=2020866 RepID=UPI00052D0601|nr:hypothetical protein JT06_07990 [Desulfobulbus sp. Tol-SR]
MTRRQNLSSAAEPPISCGPHSPDSAAGEYNAGDPRPENPPGLPVVLDDFDAEAMARRRLLKLAAYTVPIVVGSLLLPQAAAASSICIPNENCSPNDPDCNPK